MVLSILFLGGGGDDDDGLGCCWSCEIGEGVPKTGRAFRRKMKMTVGGLEESAVFFLGGKLKFVPV